MPSRPCRLHEHPWRNLPGRRLYRCTGRAKRSGAGARFLALWLGLALVHQAGCKEENALLLTVSAESRVDTYDLYVLDRARGEVVLAQVGEVVDSENPTRDISVPGEELKVSLLFSRPGRYLLHMVGRSHTTPQVSTQLVQVKGATRQAVHLVSVSGYDSDGDGFLGEGPCLSLDSPSVDCSVVDCNDADPDIHPLATEVCGNGVDENCDGVDPPCRDADGDGAPENLDCDDNDPERFPGNPEGPNDCPTTEHPGGLADPKCDDGVDQDCDGRDAVCVEDGDCDGYPAAVDCNDHDATINPGASEICGNGVDENCTGVADEGCVPCDLDGDGFERIDLANSCPRADYPVDKAIDCDDTNAAVVPDITAGCGGFEGGSAACAALGLCDGLDNDCDGEVDEGCPTLECDQDRDGYMNTSPGCNPPTGLEDCDDTDPHVYPGAPDRCGDGILQNCNTDTPCNNDQDGDGFNADVDCDDSDAAVYPGAPERCNGLDDDCDSLVDEGNPDADGVPMLEVFCNDDPDGDCGNPAGAGRCVCTKVVPATHRDTGRVICSGEDLGATASPRCFFAPQPGPELCDAADHDCDGRNDAPEGTNLLEVGQPCGINVGRCMAGLVVGCQLDQTTVGATNPHFLCDADFVGPEAETCNGIDDDCDGSLPLDEQDLDSDGYMACTGCPGALPAPLLGCGDCAPLNSSRHPNQPEDCNNIDDNCANGITDDGADQCAGGTPDCCSNLSLCVDLDTDFNHCGSCTAAPCNTMRTNLCVGGECRCGSGPACASGQQCVGSGTSASCQCTAASCGAGCCSGTSCILYASQSATACGTGGAACQACLNGRTCSASGVCVCFGSVTPPNESTCGDSVDNDCDGQVDCNDGNCGGLTCGANGRVCSGTSCVCSGNGGTAQAAESICDDAHDNDCDGAVDCADGQCSGLACGPNGRFCVGTSCQCSGNGGAAQATESTCDDGFDNDCDGLVDCNDPHCNTRTCGPNGRVCSGTSCVCSGNGGTAQASESLCSDAHDNDCDGLTDCADTQCNGLTCGANGRTCSGTSCVCSGNGGTAQATETSCTDTYDNDCDGLTDCADPHCAGVTCGANGRICVAPNCVCSGNGGAAQATETTCNDGFDNDCDGLTDCADPHCDTRTCGANGRVCSGTSCVCSGNGGAAQASETTCNDGFDNDCDGLVDCADNQCNGLTCGANGRVCSGTSCVCSGNGGTAQATESTCDDAHDNDCDGLVDCADPHCEGLTCANNKVCEAGACK